MDRFLVFFPSRKCIKQVMINLMCYEMCFSTLTVFVQEIGQSKWREHLS